MPKRETIRSADAQLAIKWLAKFKAANEAEGLNCYELSFEEVISHWRTQGAISMLTFMRKDDPESMMYDPDAVLIRDLRAKLAIADAWLRGELDARPTPENIRKYELVGYPFQVEPETEIDLATA